MGYSRQIYGFPAGARLPDSCSGSVDTVRMHSGGTVRNGAAPRPARGRPADAGGVTPTHSAVFQSCAVIAC